MPSLLHVAALQLNPKEGISDNIQKAIHAVCEARQKGAGLVVLPELFIYRGNPKQYGACAEKKGGAITALFCSLARHLKVAIILGTVIEESSMRNQYFDTTYCISSQGEIVGSYRKINLFEVALKGTAVCERDYFLKGTQRIFVDIAGHRVGCAICFDIRFPALFQEMAQSDVELFVVPSNFTYATGKDHWTTLLRTRAIETQSYIIAANCCGVDPYSKVRSFGHSMIIDPWGTIIKELGDKEGSAHAVIDFDYRKQVKKQLPLKIK